MSTIAKPGASASKCKPVYTKHCVQKGLQLVNDHRPVQEQQPGVQEFELHEDGHAKNDGELVRAHDTSSCATFVANSLRSLPEPG